MLTELVPLVEKLRATRAALDCALDSVSDEQATQRTLYADWTIKRVVAHLIGAERGMTRLAQRFAAGENPTLPADYNNDVYNARQVAKREALSFAQARAELAASRRDLIAFLETLTPAQLELRGEHPVAGNISLNELLGVIAHHEAQHHQQILDTLEKAK